MQIMRALLTGKGWVNHPATLMWRGYEFALLDYQKAVVARWCYYGYKDTCLKKTMQLYFAYQPKPRYEFPPWFGNEMFHMSHRSNLLRKNFEYYRPKFPDTPLNMEYIWPTQNDLMSRTRRQTPVRMLPYDPIHVHRRPLKVA